jgi:hypothetical protein
VTDVMRALNVTPEFWLLDSSATTLSTPTTTLSTDSIVNSRPTPSRHPSLPSLVVSSQLKQEEASSAGIKQEGDSEAGFDYLQFVFNNEVSHAFDVFSRLIHF